MIDAVRRFFSAHRIGPCHLLVACSGGIDSTALLLLAAELRHDGFRVTAGHVNHHLRGEESDADETFVRSLCEANDIDLHVVDGSLDRDEIRDGGVESAARDARCHALNGIAAESGADYIATAHQKNDQAETVLMRLLTGTGLAGLRGIHPVRADRWIRPLIDVTRAEIETFLRERGVSARVDRMNADPRFLRNQVRQVLGAFGPATVEHLAAVATQAAQVWPILERTIDAVERSCAIVTADETRFVRWPEDSWLRQALLNRHIRRLGSAREISSDDLQRIAASVGDIRRVSVTRDLELVLQERSHVLRRASGPTAAFQIEMTAPGTAFIGEIGVTITIGAGDAEAASRTAQMFQLPAGAEPNFIIRNRRAGDRFQPLGMQQDKKLKDFLIDRKIGAAIRDAIPLLIWSNEIVWVGGVEVSERFKVTGDAVPLYEVKLEHAPRDD